ncbi:ROK family protein [Candidatus Clostridium radicumherbarum]|uniref:ROK family protein n=1 Tax=Candidatus Clostridium radicumherbarum TaxID=3381662 RepID=A0ABW8TRM5_9CLOT
MKLRIGNKQLIRDINRQLIINEVRLNAPMSRTDLAKNLKLGLSTITNIVEELKEQNLVFETGEADSTGGRKPIMLDFNHQYGYTIGIKIEENCMLLALTDLKVEVKESCKVTFKKNSNSDIVLYLLIESIDKLINKIPKGKSLMGIGIAISGLVDQKKGQLIFSGMLNWKGINICKILEEHFKVAVFIDNDVNAYTLAELWQGKGKSLSDFIVVTYGSGVGSGIVLNHKLYRGNFGGAGEIGHMVIDIGGKKCECGQRGCLEAYASEAFILEYIKENKEFYNDCIIDVNEDLSIEKVYEYAKQGDMLAINGLKLSAKYFAYGLVSIINLLNPSTIILAGEGLVAKDIIIPVVKDIVKDNFFKMHNKKVEVLISDLGGYAFEIGASLLVVSKLFEMPLYEERESSLSSL